ncbi:MAG: 16S rRNA (guanine(527)-N(7))-methyltransferase RsmG [Brachyspira sp.]|jgi:16S rRNA methyltransferase gidB|nr:16S rRNA (guanine(527)-N(7))-methyltransferase RsmG [Brachyspira sp.]
MKTKDYFNDYIKVFLEQNAKLNLISKNDEKFVWEKHIFDSLSIEKFFEKYGNNFKTILDFGTGGGFPSVPVALAYSELHVTALDSIGKKINAVTEIKEALHIDNLTTVCSRVENFDGKFDIVTTRAVASLDKIIHYAIPKLKNDGYFVAYKSIKAAEEIKEAQKSLQKFKAKVIDIIEYELPLEQNHTRNLVIIKKY